MVVSIFQVRGPRCVAEYDFGENKADLRFEKGDVIQILEWVSAEWRVGKLKGYKGLSAMMNRFSCRLRHFQSLYTGYLI